MKDIKKHKLFKSISICLVVVTISIAFVFFLNWVLLQPALFKIVENDSPPATWLQFLGGFLSAIGTIVMAVFTYITLCEQKKQYNYDKESNRYDILEKLIIKNEEIQHIDQLKHIANVYLIDGYYTAKKLSLDLLIKLQNVANELVRFNNHSDRDYQEYGEVLKVLNIKMYTLLLILSSRMEWHEGLGDLDLDEYSTYLAAQDICIHKEAKEDDINKFLQFAESFYNKPIQSDHPYGKLTKLGNQLLLKKIQILQEKEI